MIELETRSNELLVDAKDREVFGYAVVFEQPSVDIGFYEVIHRGAITQETLDSSDILCKFNHNDEKVLARSKYGKGSLQLGVDDIGVWYRFEAPNTDLGNELLEYLRRGDVSQSSFAFTVATDGDKFHYENGTTYRDIYKIDRLYDVSPVFTPAYSNTSCSKRVAEFTEGVTKLLQELDDLIIK